MNAERRERAYFDSSVLVKTYFNEVGSRRARELVRKYRIVSSSLAPVEIMATLYRQRAAAILREEVLKAIVSRLASERRFWDIVQLDSDLMAAAEEVVMSAPIRTLDALHVAAALSIQKSSRQMFPFVTADMRQVDAAKRLGLQTIAV